MKNDTDRRTEQLERMAQKIILILQSKEISEEIQDAVFAIADNAIINGEDSSTRVEYINERFVRALLSLDRNYASGVLQSLHGVMESAIDEKIYQRISDESLNK